MTAAAALPPLDVVDRFDGAAVWAALPEAVRTTIGTNLLSGAVGDLLVHHGAATGDLRCRRVGAAVGAKVSDELASMVGVILQGVELPGGAPRIPALLGMVCASCGCSEMDACPGRCGWAAPNLCTACAAAGPAAAPAPASAAG